MYPRCQGSGMRASHKHMSLGYEKKSNRRGLFPPVPKEATSENLSWSILEVFAVIQAVLGDYIVWKVRESPESDDPCPFLKSHLTTPLSCYLIRSAWLSHDLRVSERGWGLWWFSSDTRKKELQHVIVNYGYLLHGQMSERCPRSVHCA